MGVLGRPGSGKSYYATQRAVAFARQGCYVVGHDIGWRLPEKDASGRPFGVVRHESVSACVSRLAGDPRGIHCLSTPEAGEVLALAVELSAASLRAHGGTHGYPTVIVIDEVVAAGICDSHYLSDHMKLIVATRRHANVGIIWTCQSARLVHNQLIGLSTEMVFFNLVSTRDLKKLEENGIDEETVRGIPSLPKYHHLVHKFQ